MMKLGGDMRERKSAANPAFRRDGRTLPARSFVSRSKHSAVARCYISANIEHPLASASPSPHSTAAAIGKPHHELPSAIAFSPRVLRRARCFVRWENFRPSRRPCQLH
jgi:hypothetical protein